MRQRLLAHCALLYALSLPSQGQVDAVPAAELNVAAGLEAVDWARSPQLYNPTAMDVDARGRVWVTEAVNYRTWGGRNPGRRHVEGDRVVILEDTDGDGVADASKVFVQEEELVAPLGIAVLGERILVAASPHMIVYTDADGDDVPDSRELFLTGFGGRDHDHGVHSFVPGPDGRLYSALGNAGPHQVTDADGWTLRSSSLYGGGGSGASGNRPGLTSDDGRVWVGGLVLSIGPDARGLEVLAHNFRNPYEVAPDSFGRLWLSDNDDDGNQCCRLSWVLEGGNYGFFSEDGSRSWQADRRPGQETWNAHWHQDDPGTAPAGSQTGSGGPTGVCVYENGLLPARFEGSILTADAGRNVVWAHTPSADGAGYELERVELVSANFSGANPAAQRWFRPSDVCVGVDGSVFVADWHDPGVGGHAMRDPEGFGRILRIAPRGRNPRHAPQRYDSVEDCIVGLSSPAPSLRYQARASLIAHGESAVAPLRTLLESGVPVLRARALYVLAQLGSAGLEIVMSARSDEDERVRQASLAALRSSGDRASLERASLELMKDPAPSVRVAALGAFHSMQTEEAPDPRLARFVTLVAWGYEGGDRTYLEAVGLAARGIEAEVWEMLASSRTESDRPLEWSDALAELAWRLHPPGLTPAFLARALAEDTLDLSRRRAAIDALAFTEERAAAEGMLALAVGGPTDTRELARHWLDEPHHPAWRDYGLTLALGADGFESARELWTSGTLREGSHALELELPEGAQRVWLVVEDAGDGDSHDWADWIDPRFDGLAGELSLRELPAEVRETGWGTLHTDKNAGGAPLTIDGTRYERGLGVHASSRMAWSVPAGATRLLVRAGVDDGGTGQNGSRTSVVMRVLVETTADRAHILEPLAVLADGAAQASAREAAIARLASTVEGGLALLKLESEGRVEEAERGMIGAALRTNPELEVRALGAARFPRTSGGSPLPPIDELATMSGDPRRGRDHFYGTSASCGNCHTRDGRGADVGPDLSSIAEKMGARELVDAILNPSAAIAHGYESWLIETDDERLWSGFLLADGPAVVLKDTAGRIHAFPAEEVVWREKQSFSVMPDDVALGLDAQELADVVQFLLYAPPAYEPDGAPIELFNGHDLSGWTHHLSNASVSRDEVWSVADGVISCVGRPSGYIRTEAAYQDFELRVRWRFPDPDRPGNSGVLMRLVGRDKVWPKSIEAQLMHRNAGDIWNIDAFPMEVDPARTNGRHTRRLQESSERALGEWNTYEIRLAGGELALVVNGVLQNSASWCEEVAGPIALQSEGAPIEFGEVVLQPLRRAD